MPIENYTYTICEKSKDGVIRYFASFLDGNGLSQESEISYDIYLILDECRRHENRQKRSMERHQERLTLDEHQLAARMLSPPNSMEDTVLLAADLQNALQTLTDTQRRRFLLYHEHGLNFQQISSVEGCSARAIEYSVEAAIKCLKKYFSGETSFLPL